MDISEYRQTGSEKARTADLCALIPDDCRGNSLDVGARDGWFSEKLAEKFDRVTALDLERPSIHHPNIDCVQGDVTNLDFASGSFDLVLCAEVLEHIPPVQLPKACAELARVARKYMIIGVPFKQDLRVGRATCYTCGKSNPAWGHVNSFDERRLAQLFPSCEIRKKSFVGENAECTNALSVFLMDKAGNPYGQYQQEEPCVHCGARLKEPPPRSFLQKLLTRLAFYLEKIQKPMHRPHANWIHLLFEKKKLSP